MKKICFLFSVLLILIVSCSKKDSPTTTETNPMAKVTVSLVDQKETSYTFNMKVISSGASEILESGICYSDSNISINPTISNKVIKASNLQEENLTVKDFAISTTYFVRAFAKNNNGISYSDAIKVKTPGTPSFRIGYSIVNETTVRYSVDVLNRGFIDLSTSNVRLTIVPSAIDLFNSNLKNSYTQNILIPSNNTSNTYSGTVDKLIPNLEYKYFINIWNSNGVWVYHSDTLRFTTNNMQGRFNWFFVKQTAEIHNKPYPSLFEANGEVFYEQSNYHPDYFKIVLKDGAYRLDSTYKLTSPKSQWQGGVGFMFSVNEYAYFNRSLITGEREFWKCNIKNNEWQNLQHTWPETFDGARFVHKYNGNFIIFSGWRNKDTVYQYNTLNGNITTFLNSFPEGRIYFANNANVYSNQPDIFGNPTNNLMSKNIITGEIKQIPSPTQESLNSTFSFSMNNAGYLGVCLKTFVSSEGYEQWFTYLYKFDFLTEKWSLVATIPVNGGGITTYSTAVVGNKAFISTNNSYYYPNYPAYAYPVYVYEE